jgi:hypothetical protein
VDSPSPKTAEDDGIIERSSEVILLGVFVFFTY